MVFFACVLKISNHSIHFSLRNGDLNVKNNRPALYKRYVDDIIIALPSDKINETLNTFNFYHQKLQFTIETEINNTISFLDIALTRVDNQITTNWYRKPTWSGRFINFFSSHPVPQKIGIIYMLVDRAIKLSHPKHHTQNLKLVRNTLYLNCYPMKFINKYINKRLRAIRTLDNSHNCRREFETKRIVNFPYIEQVHQPLQLLLRPYSINLINNNKHNIHTITGSTKDRIPSLLRSNIVYRIPCKDCPSAYIGQTKRYLKTRIQEHENSIKHLNSNRTALTNHVISSKHSFDFCPLNRFTKKELLMKWSK